MRCIDFLWVTLALSRCQIQGHLAIYREYRSPRVLHHGRINAIIPSISQGLTTIHHCRIKQLVMMRRHLEALTTRLNFELQELQARRHYAYEQLEGPGNQGRCNCESADVTIPPTPPSVEYENGNQFIKNASWQLEPTESKGSDIERTMNDGGTLSSRHTSFLSSTFFVLVVFCMVVPVACILGFVLFCKRRRPLQYTHA